MAGLPSRVFVRSPLATIVCDRKCKPTCFSKKRVCWLPKQNIWVLCSFQAWLDSGLSPRHSFPGALALSTAGFASFSGSGWQGSAAPPARSSRFNPAEKSQEHTSQVLRLILIGSPWVMCSPLMNHCCQAHHAMIGLALEKLCADWLIPEKMLHAIGLVLGLGPL